MFTGLMCLNACSTAKVEKTETAQKNIPNPLAVTPTLTPDNQSDKSKIKVCPGVGVVTKIDMEIGSVELNHEEIKCIPMPSMIMEFNVSDKKMLENLKVGDKVKFKLEDNAGAERIIEIIKSSK